MITIDYDYIAYTELMRRVEFIKKDSICKSIEIYQSPSCNGYHLYVSTTRKLNFSERVQYRKMFKDDGQRIVFDLLKDEQCKEVLFSQRRNKGIITKEIFIQQVA